MLQPTDFSNGSQPTDSSSRLQPTDISSGHLHPVSSGVIQLLPGVVPEGVWNDISPAPVSPRMSTEASLPVGPLRLTVGPLRLPVGPSLVAALKGSS